MKGGGALIGFWRTCSELVEKYNLADCCPALPPPPPPDIAESHGGLFLSQGLLVKPGAGFFPLALVSDLGLSQGQSVISLISGPQL